MGKRHHASRRRAYGRRQHEVRERSERPARDELEALGVRVHEIPPRDATVLEGLTGRSAPAGRVWIVPAPAD